MIPVPVGPYIVLLQFNLVALVESVCPHCSGNFASCSWDDNQRCPTVTVVAANAAIVAGGAGALVLAELILNRFLRVFQRSALETIRSLVRRPQPGTQFELTATTSGPSILSAIQTCCPYPGHEPEAAPRNQFSAAACAICNGCTIAVFKS